MPEGTLICARNGTHYKWYQSDGCKKKYIPKSNKSLAEQLAFKKYLLLQSEEICQKLNALNAYLKLYPQHTNTSETLLTQDSCYAELLASLFTPLSEELSDWATSEYERNPSHPEQLLHKTASGNIVRSKSEAMIDLFLYNNRIPFRYECALCLDGITLFPDFTIRHPKTGRFFYWEHFGRMDDPSYYKNVYSKLHLYTSNGIVPSIQLITTFETKEYPLTIETIQRTIEYYFL